MRIRFNIILTLSILLCSIDKTVGQDIHFSQYKSSLVIINPANAGVMNADYRFNINSKKITYTPYGIPLAVNLSSMFQI